MESDFEKDIERAFRRMRRQELKAQLQQTEAQVAQEEAQFEQDIADAARLAQRSAMKDRLRALEGAIAANEESTAPVVEPPTRSIGNYWRYAAAASVILVVGLTIYLTMRLSPSSTESPATIAQQRSSSQQQPTTRPAKSPSDEKAPAEAAPARPQDLRRELPPVELTIKQEEQLGYAGSAAKKIWLRQQTNPRASQGVRYRLTKDTLVISGGRQQAVRSVLEHQNQRYMRIGDTFYYLTPTDRFQPLKSVKDEALRAELERVDFQD